VELDLHDRVHRRGGGDPGATRGNLAQSSEACTHFPISVWKGGPVNDNVYIHEFIDIIGHN
jgi:hypothetical protein